MSGLNRQGTREPTRLKLLTGNPGKRSPERGRAAARGGDPRCDQPQWAVRCIRHGVAAELPAQIPFDRVDVLPL